ncbi:MAG: hypothetical protein Q8P01_00595 [bacterium]|nr:hypothetical protein [bacterium]
MSLNVFGQDGEEIKGYYGQLECPYYTKIKAANPSEITAIEYVYATAPRQTGLYKHGSAEAEVNLGIDREKGAYWRISVIVTAPKGSMADIKEGVELYRQIRAGEIRPLRSFDQPQITEEEWKLKRQAELKLTTKVRVSVCRILQRIGNQIHDFIVKVRSLVGKVHFRKG